MHKYICLKCGKPAKNTDFYTAAESTDNPVAVYAFCKPCNSSAWGGFQFHPDMNIVFNNLFMANDFWNYKDDPLFTHRGQIEF